MAVKSTIINVQHGIHAASIGKHQIQVYRRLGMSLDHSVK